MVRKEGYIPKHCHHKAKNLGYVCLNGKTIYTRPWGSDEANAQPEAEAEAEYDRVIAEWLNNGRQLPPRLKSEGSYLVKHLAADFWRWAKLHYRKGGKPTREMNNIRDALRPLLHLYGHTVAEHFGPLALTSLQEHVVREGRWARTTINSRINIVRRIFKWAAATERVPASVYEGIRVVPGLQRGRTTAREPDAVHAVTEANMLAVLPHVSPQVAAMIMLQWHTGMRPGEVVVMRWSDITRTDDWWLYEPPNHKTEHYGKRRLVWLGDKARSILREWLRMDDQAYLFSPLEAEQQRRRANREARKTKVTPSQTRRDQKRSRLALRRYGNAYTPDTYRQAISRACKEASVSSWTPNQIRHAAATRIRDKFGLDCARAALGQNSISVTQRYAAFSEAKAKEAMNELG